MADNITMDKLALLYKKIKADRDQKKQHYKGELKALQSDLDKVALEAQKLLQNAGIESARTDNGTFFMQQGVKASLADATLFKDWVIEHKQLGLLQNSIAINNLKEYLEDGDGVLPPGVNMFVENKVHFRSA